jgi:hypothetical protein
LLLGVTGWKSFRSALPKTTLPLTKNTVAAVARVIPFEHPFSKRQKQTATTLPNEAKRIGNVRDWQRVRESKKQDLLSLRDNFPLLSSKGWHSRAEFCHQMSSINN